MRVITGAARGCRLQTLEGTETRPTSEKVKEALFSSIQFDIAGRRVLDLFAGSGQLGIEALSRGASGCVFVDKNPDAVAVIRQNVQRAGFSSVSQIVGEDSLSFLIRPKDRFDLVFLDPPYAGGLMLPALTKVTDVVSDGGIIVCETDEGTAMPEQLSRFSLERHHRYGRIHLWVYRGVCTE